MNARALASSDTVVAASPLWLRLVDVMTHRPPQGPLGVLLELQRGTEWEPIDRPHHLSAAGDLGFIGLGRSRPGQTGTFQVRVTVTAPRMQAAAPGGDAGVVTSIALWTDQSPPAPAMQEITFFPAPDYPFGAGLPLLTGRVVDIAGEPVARAAVTVVETVRGAPVVEQTLSDPDGWFRLPVRWSDGNTQLDAVRAPLAGSITFDVSDDLTDVVTVTLT